MQARGEGGEERGVGGERTVWVGTDKPLFLENILEERERERERDVRPR